jgi:Zn-dependent peptidase ImmA (M78 family)
MKEKLKRYQKILRLEDWDIELHEVSALDSVASTKMIFNEYTAIIEIKKELDEKNKELSLIHELLHIIFRDEIDIITQDIEDETVKTFLLRYHERSIDRLAHIMQEEYRRIGD